jgi:RimJ/RimL family protein N-acetyltransferase
MVSMTRISLRDVTDSDLDVFFNQQLDEVATAMAAFRPRDRAAFDKHWAKILSDDSTTQRTITAEGEVVGNIVSWVQDGHREIGYWIGRPFWGHGIATAAVARFVSETTERPLQAWVADHNAASIRVLEKCGFVRSDEQPDPEAGGVRYVVLELRD